MATKKKKKTGLPKITIFVVMGVSIVLLAFLTVWLVGELKSTFGGPQLSSGTTATAKPSTTASGDTPATSATTEMTDEVVLFVEAQMDEMLADKNVTLTAGGISIKINAKEANAPVDYDALKQYMTSQGLDSALVGKYQTILQTTNAARRKVDGEYVANCIDELAKLIDKGADTSYTLVEGGVTITRGTERTVFDTDAAAEKVTEALNGYDYGTVEMQVNTQDPGLPDMEELHALLKVDASDAKYDVDEDNNTIVVAEVVGKDIDIAAIESEIKTGTWKTKTFYTYSVDPQITAENVDQGLFGDVLGKCTTYYQTYEKNRTSNLTLAATSLDGCIVLPGNTFSFNRVVGQRTEERGYKEAIIFQNGAMENGIGGGICQVSSTAYIAACYAEMHQVSRYAHAFTVSYCDIGMDATVYWGSYDYVFRNTTEYPVKISVSCSGGTLTIKILGTETRASNRTIKFTSEIVETYDPEITYETDDTLEPGTSKVVSKGKPGYKVITYKLEIVDGVVQKKTQFATSNYSPYKGKTLVGPDLPVTEATTTEATTPPTAPPTEATTAAPTQPPETTAAPETTEPEVSAVG